MIGTRLGPYEITAKLGEGGMGLVFRAKDFHLGREVALKVLPEGLNRDPERLARFEREAKLLAQLNHPNIAQIHGLEVRGDTRALVMELVEGPTLAERLEKGSLPIDESLSIARQIAEALEEAHERGIIHRDLKPQNIKASIEGKVKVLDFGLAKAMDPTGSYSALPLDLAHSPTVTFGGTREGVILGTAAYMAPEQARGGAVDKRADIWAFGVVLYEMLTGERLFAEGSVVDTLSAVMRKPIDFGRLPAGTPRPLRELLRRCLERDPKRRLRDVGDGRLVLEEVAAGGADAGPADSVRATGTTRRERLAWALFALAALAALSTSFVLRSRETGAGGAIPSSPRVVAVTPLTVDPGYEGGASPAPDGESVAYVADREGQFDIYLQQVGGSAAINLTKHPADDVQPAISPDGRLLAFVSTRESRLELVYRSPGYPLLGGDVWVVPVLGGLPRKIAEDGSFPTWSPDGRTIYYSRGLDFRSEIRRVAAIGGESEVIPITLPETTRPVFLFSPQVSPDGRWLLFSAAESIFLAPIAGGSATNLGAGRFAVWAPSGGAILYCSVAPGQNSGLHWLPFDSSRGAASGPASPFLVGPSALEQPTFARRGTRVLVTAVDRTSNLEALAIDAESGIAGATPQTLTTGRNDINFATISPDRRSIVYTDLRGSASHLWRLDLGGDPIQLTEDPSFAESYPRWSPDGRLIAFARRPANTPRLGSNAELWIMAPDGGGARLLTREGGHMAWLPDSKRLLYLHLGTYHLMDLEGGANEQIHIEGPESMAIFVVSPDGRWIVYQSAERGNVDLAIAPLAGGRARWLVETDRQDHHPNFSPGGRWLYFQPDHRNLWRIPGPAQDWRPAPPQQVTHFPESGLYLEEPQLSSDGKQLFYSRIRTRGDLWVVDLEGPGARDGAPGPPPA